ncbi:MAG: inner membrane CreD family protein [Acidobacteria bacterium]|nr:inner membrane CreD family protein [Acidobacteriota bacterium]
MVKRIAAVGFIFICTSIAWAVLAGTIFSRTYHSDGLLRGKVASAWGSKHAQQPPSLTQWDVGPDGKSRSYSLPLEQSGIQAGIHLEHRQKGLLWFNTYKVEFAGDYLFRNDTTLATPARLRFPLPADQAVYDGLVVSRDGVPLPTVAAGNAVEANLSLAPGQSATVRVSYASQGLDRWEYRFGKDAGQVRNFSARVRTNFRDADFPENTLSPTTKRETPHGAEFDWTYRALLSSGVPLAVVMPGKPQPGPLAGEIVSFAPVSLFFFFFLMLLITTLKGIDLHPVNYFFLACAFFAFHLLLAYLADHISIHAAFAVSSAVSVALVISYLRLAVGLRFALVEAGLSQFFYLVLFSYAFFFPGYTGLAITIGTVATLFVVMQATGRVNWNQRLRPPVVTAAAPPGTASGGYSPPGR